jgi:hypothetical protein
MTWAMLWAFARRLKVAQRDYEALYGKPKR